MSKEEFDYYMDYMPERIEWLTFEEMMEAKDEA